MDDLISREDALKALDEMSYKSPHESATSVVRKKHFGEVLEKFIMQQPSAQQWIPCSERLPEKYAEVWVTLRGLDMIVCKDGETLAEAAERVWKENIRVSIGFYGSDGWYDIYGYPSMISPVAWMPINEPEPYEGENDG